MENGEANVRDSTETGSETRLASRRSLAKLLNGLNGQALISVGLKATGALLALALQWAVARLYGATGSGLFALMATATTFIGVVAAWGQDFIVLRNVSGDLAENRYDLARGNVRASLRIAVVGTLVGTVAIAGLALLYSGPFGQSKMTPILLWALPVCAGLAIARLFAFTARAGGAVIASQLPDGPLTSLVALLALGIIALVWPSTGTWVLGLVYGVAYASALFYSFALARKVMQRWPTGTAQIDSAPLVRGGMLVALASATPYLTDWLILFTVDATIGTAAAGQVRIVALFTSVMFLVTIAFESVFSPAMAAALRLDRRAEVTRLYRQYAFGSAALALPIVIAAVLFPGLLLQIFGPDFVSAAPALRAAVVIQLLTILLGPAGTILIMGKRESAILIVNAAGALFLVVGCFFLIPHFGVLGGVLASVGTLFVKRMAEIVVVRRMMGLRLLV